MKLCYLYFQVRQKMFIIKMTPGTVPQCSNYLVGSHLIQPSKGNGLFYTGKLKFLLLYTYITM